MDPINSQKKLKFHTPRSFQSLIDQNLQFNFPQDKEEEKEKHLTQLKQMRHYAKPTITSIKINKS